MAELIRLFLTFMKIGILGFGGGPSMIPLTEVEVVDGHRWLSHEEFSDSLALGNSLPGPIITKMAAFVGLKVAGVAGAVVAAFGVVFPSLLAMMLLTAGYFEVRDLPWARAMTRAVAPVVVVLLFQVFWDQLRKLPQVWDSVVVALGGLIIVLILRLHPLYAILAAAAFGLVAYRAGLTGYR
ncbi:MAG: chromate transporter [Deinococcus sp.]|nr:chromate transporter [Deinococcus sp.]